jgi:hypothetical protein
MQNRRLSVQKRMDLRSRKLAEKSVPKYWSLSDDYTEITLDPYVRISG